MRRTELFRFAAGAIIAHPMRSALTTLGVVIGVAAVVTMTSIGLGASKQVESSISSLGSNLITVQPGSNRAPGGFVNQGAGANVSMTSKDTDAIKAQVTGIAAISSGVPSRPMGWRAMKAARAASASPPAAIRSCSEGLSVVPGQMELQRTPWPMKSRATERVRPISAALVVA